MRVVADLQFEVQLRDPRRPSHPAPVQGRVRASGDVVTVTFSREPSVLGGGSIRIVRPLATALDRNGLTLVVLGPTGPLASFGRGVRAPWWQVPATGTRYVRLGSARALASTLRGPRVLDGLASALPLTLPAAHASDIAASRTLHRLRTAPARLIRSAIRRARHRSRSAG